MEKFQNIAGSIFYGILVLFVVAPLVAVFLVFCFTVLACYRIMQWAQGK